MIPRFNKKFPGNEKVMSIHKQSQASAVAIVVAMLHHQRWELRCFRCGIVVQHEVRLMDADSTIMFFWPCHTSRPHLLGYSGVPIEVNALVVARNC